MDMADGSGEWNNEDVVDAILESTSQVVGAIDRLRTTILWIVLTPFILWLLIALIGVVNMLAVRR